MKKPASLSDIEKILIESSRITNHRHYIIAGSLSILGAMMTPPDDMCFSTDVDLYPKFDPGRAGEIAAQIGEESDYAKQHGFYADAISPQLLSLPRDWEIRILQIPMSGGVVGWFIDPVDVAASKLIRGEERDIAWVACGIKHGIIQSDTLKQRLGSIDNCLEGEIPQARCRLEDILMQNEAQYGLPKN